MYMTATVAWNPSKSYLGPKCTSSESIFFTSTTATMALQLTFHNATKSAPVQNTSTTTATMHNATKSLPDQNTSTTATMALQLTLPKVTKGAERLHHCNKGLWFSTTDFSQCYQHAIGGCGQDCQLRTCTSLRLPHQFKGDLILGDDSRSVPTKLFNYSRHTQHCPRL